MTREEFWLMNLDDAWKMFDDLEKERNELAKKSDCIKLQTETIHRLRERIEELNKDLLIKDDELVLVRMHRDKAHDLCNNLTLEGGKLLEEHRHLQRDLDLFRSLVEMFVKERISDE